MKKGVLVSLIVAASLIILGAVLFAVGIMNHGSLSYSSSDFNIGLLNRISLSGSGDDDSYENYSNRFEPSGSYQYNGSDVNSVSILWPSGSVNINVYDGDGIIIRETSHREISEDISLGYGVKDGVLYIQYYKNGSAFFMGFGESGAGKDLEVSLPGSLARSLKTLSFDVASADIVSQEVSAGKLEVDAVSGTCLLSGKFREADISSSSGDITLQSLGTSSEAEINTVSGNIELQGDFSELELESTSGNIMSTEDITSDEVSVSTVSGDIHLTGIIHSLDAESTSGNITFISSVTPRSLAIDTTSGESTVVIPPESGFTLNISTVSGEFYNDFSVKTQDGRYIAGSGSGDYSFSSVSGSLKLKSGS